jgi:hypothetical protein
VIPESNAAKFNQDRFAEKIAALDKLIRKFGWETFWRALPVYLTKLLVGISGILVALKVSNDRPQILGISITILVLIDGIFANKIVLLAAYKARKACQSLKRELEAEHTQGIAEVIKIEESNSVGRAQALNRLLEILIVEYDTGIDKILKAKADVDIKAIQKVTKD